MAVTITILHTIVVHIAYTQLPCAPPPRAQWLRNTAQLRRLHRSCGLVPGLYYAQLHTVAYPESHAPVQSFSPTFASPNLVSSWRFRRSNY